MGIFRKNENNVIEYTVNKVANKGIYISVQNGEVLVNAPWYVTSNQIQNIVEEKRKWILEKLAEYEMQKKNKRMFNNKEITMLGEEYLLNIRYTNIEAPEANLRTNNIEIILPNKYKKVDNTKIIKVIINKIYNSLAEKEIEMAMEKTRILLGFAPDNYKIEKINNTLGKCENGIITINPDIIIFNRDIIEYVIMHEFCHLKYKTHSKKFNELIEKNFKNHKNYENIIKEYKF